VLRSEGGQASVEWVGAVLAVAIALGALARLSDRVDASGVAAAGLRATGCVLAGCERGEARGHARRGPATAGARAVTLPPLLPPPSAGGGAAGARSRPSLRLTNPVPPRVRARFGAFWRRAWVACFAYERARWGLLHPESYRQAVPLRDVVQMANDCLSPFDLSRDWEHLRP
jgi:hypothetical protein